MGMQGMKRERSPPAHNYVRYTGYESLNSFFVLRKICWYTYSVHFIYQVLIKLTEAASKSFIFALTWVCTDRMTT